MTVKDKYVYCGISGFGAKATCEDLTYQLLDVLIPHIIVRQAPYIQHIINLSEK